MKTRFESRSGIVSDLLTGEKFSGAPQELKVNVPAYGARIIKREKI